MFLSSCSITPSQCALYDDGTCRTTPHPDLSRSALWRMVLRDATLKLSIRYVCIVASMDFFLFMFLQHIVHARSMATVAILVIVTMVGVVMPFTVRMIAAWHMVIGGIGVQPKTLETAWWERVVVRYATWRFAPHCSGMTIVTIVTVVVTLYLNRFLNVDSNPEHFCAACQWEKHSMTLGSPDNRGAIYMDFIGFRGDDLSDPSFVQTLPHMYGNCVTTPAVRGVLSPTDFLEEVLVRTSAESAIRWKHVCCRIIKKDCGSDRHPVSCSACRGMGTDCTRPTNGAHHCAE